MADEVHEAMVRRIANGMSLQEAFEILRDSYSGRKSPHPWIRLAPEEVVQELFREYEKSVKTENLSHFISKSDLFDWTRRAIEFTPQFEHSVWRFLRRGHVEDIQQFLMPLDTAQEDFAEQLKSECLKCDFARDDIVGFKVAINDAFDVAGQDKPVLLRRSDPLPDDFRVFFRRSLHVHRQDDGFTDSEYPSVVFELYKLAFPSTDEITDQWIEEYCRENLDLRSINVHKIREAFKDRAASFSFESIVQYTPDEVRNALKNISFQNFREIDYTIFESAMDDVKYIDKFGIIQQQYTVINGYTRLWDPNNYYSCYTSYTQSSGVGKTRLLLEMHRKDVFVVYFCLRKEKDTGYPRPRPLADSFSQNLNVAYFEKFLLAVLHRILEEKEAGISYEQFMKMCRDDDEFWKDIQTKIGEIKATDTIKSDVEKACSSIGQSSLKVLFVFDEASTMVKEAPEDQIPFVALRRALKILPTKGCAFAVFADTFSNISNFSPPKTSDPSTSARRGQSAKLFPPIFLYPIDIAEIATPIFDKDQVCHIKNLSRYGRALWYSTYETLQTKTLETAESEMVHLSKLKLLKGETITTIGSSIPQELAFAVLSSRLDIHAGLFTRFTEKLVSSYMMLLGFVFPDRNHILAGYYPEPLLAEGAAHCFWSLGPEKCLNAYYDVMEAMSTGESRELVARMLLLFSKDVAVGINEPPVHRDMKSTLDFFQDLNEVVFSKVCTVRSFLASLLFDMTRFLGSDWSWLDSAFVNFSHFTRIEYAPDIKDLERFYSRLLAVICKENQKGVDLIIPILIEKTTPRKTTQKISWILIQVKNRSSSVNIEEGTENLDTSSVNLKNTDEYLTLLMSLRGARPRVESKKMDDKRYHVNLIGMNESIYKLLSREQFSGCQGILKKIAEHKFDAVNRNIKDGMPENLARGMWSVKQGSSAKRKRGN